MTNQALSLSIIRPITRYITRSPTKIQANKQPSDRSGSPPLLIRSPQSPCTEACRCEWVWSPLRRLSQQPRTRSPSPRLTQPSRTRSPPSKTIVGPQRRTLPPPIFCLFDEQDLQKELWRTKPPVRSLRERERERTAFGVQQRDCMRERLIWDCFGEGKRERESG